MIPGAVMAMFLASATVPGHEWKEMVDAHRCRSPVTDIGHDGRGLAHTVSLEIGLLFILSAHDWFIANT